MCVCVCVSRKLKVKSKLLRQVSVLCVGYSGEKTQTLRASYKNAWKSRKLRT